MPDYQTLVMRRTVGDALDAARTSIEREVLPEYLSRRRWFAMKDEKLKAARIALLTRVPAEDYLLLEIESETASGTARWLLPVGIVWEETNLPPLQIQLGLARVRRGARVGLLTDAFAMPQFARGVLSALADQDKIVTDAGVIHCESTSRMADVVVPADVEMHWISAEQSNSSVIIGDIAVLKLFRRVSDGPHPEAEMGRHLTEQGYQNVPALLGEVVRVDPEGVRHSLAIVQAFVRNQGDAWTWTLDLLTRGLSDLGAGDEAAIAEATAHADYVEFARLLGQRLGEMHEVLSRPVHTSAFRPEEADTDNVESLRNRVWDQLQQAARAVERAQATDAITEADRTALEAALPALETALPRLTKRLEGTMLTRIHGDLHLGQILVASGDVFLIDFEGEPAKPVAARVAKDHRLRDVAGLLRSFQYAAAMVRRRGAASHAHLSDEAVGPYLDRFRDQAATAFLAGYREKMDVDDQLLTVFLIEKAAYEVVYEATNRPTWIDVPLRGLLQYLTRYVEAVA